MRKFFFHSAASLVAMGTLLSIAFLAQFGATALVQTASANENYYTYYQIWGSWKPITACSGCNPDNAWSGTGATNTGGESIVIDNLSGGDTISIGSLGGAVSYDGGTTYADCRTGSRKTAKVPQQVPILQVLNTRNEVVSLEDGGYNNTNSLRLMDLQGKSFTVPTFGRKLWVSWPDDTYTDNTDLCYFSMAHIQGDELTVQAMSSSSQSRSSSVSSRSSSQAQSSSQSISLVTREIETSSSSVSSESSSSSEESSSSVTVFPVATMPTHFTVRDYRNICRVWERIELETSSLMRRKRTVERLANRHSTTVTSVQFVIDNCTPELQSSIYNDEDFVFDDDRNIVFVGTPRSSSSSSEPSQPEEETTYSSSVSSIGTTTTNRYSVGSTSSVRSFASSSSKEHTEHENEESASPTNEHMLNVLARVQNRVVDRTPEEKEEIYREAANYYAQRWNVPSERLFEILSTIDIANLEGEEIVVYNSSDEYEQKVHGKGKGKHGGKGILPHAGTILLTIVSIGILLLLLSIILSLRTQEEEPEE